MITPSYLLNISDEIDRQGIDPGKLALRAGILGAEPWTEAMRADRYSRHRGIAPLRMERT